MISYKEWKKIGSEEFMRVTRKTELFKIGMVLFWVMLALVSTVLYVRGV